MKKRWLPCGINGVCLSLMNVTAVNLERCTAVFRDTSKQPTILALRELPFLQKIGAQMGEQPQTSLMLGNWIPASTDT